MNIESKNCRLSSRGDGWLTVESKKTGDLRVVGSENFDYSRVVNGSEGVFDSYCSQIYSDGRGVHE